MYTILKNLYDKGRLTETQLDHAVEIGWITEEEKEKIIEPEEN